MPKWLSKLERRLRPLAIPNLTLILILGQVAFYVVANMREGVADRMTLDAQAVFQGQWWRLFTFPFVPPLTNPLFAFFAWYLFYLMGTALEANWGVLRYNAYLLIAALATIGVAFAFPGTAATNAYIGGSVFLAFAYLYPDFELMIFFILPVKVKYLAMLTWAMYFYIFVFAGSWVDRANVAASVANFFLFFGSDVLARMRMNKRRMDTRAKRLVTRDKPFHTCTACGITNQTHPQMEFRYCSKCTGTRGYCTEHLRNHEHVVESPAADQSSQASL